MTRILITGAPRTGKTTLARKMSLDLGLSHWCTDPNRLCPPAVGGSPDDLDWSECSEWVAQHWIGTHAIIEGVAVPRALRKWRALHPDEPPPVDRLLVLSQQRERLTKRQEAMGTALLDVLDELGDWLAPVLVWSR